MTDVVLPCLDEAGALPWVLSRMPAGYRPIVVDNGSTDGSAEIAAQLVAAAGHGWRIGEVDVGYAPRTGRSKVSGTVRGTARAVRDMANVLSASRAAA